jgi:hypothetical protein
MARATAGRLPFDKALRVAEFAFGGNQAAQLVNSVLEMSPMDMLFRLTSRQVPPCLTRPA